MLAASGSRAHGRPQGRSPGRNFPLQTTKPCPQGSLTASHAPPMAAALAAALACAPHTLAQLPAYMEIFRHGYTPRTQQRNGHTLLVLSAVYRTQYRQVYVKSAPEACAQKHRQAHQSHLLHSLPGRCPHALTRVHNIHSSSLVHTSQALRRAGLVRASAQGKVFRPRTEAPQRTTNHRTKLQSVHLSQPLLPHRSDPIV